MNTNENHALWTRVGDDSAVCAAYLATLTVLGPGPGPGPLSLTQSRGLLGSEGLGHIFWMVEFTCTAFCNKCGREL